MDVHDHRSLKQREECSVTLGTVLTYANSSDVPSGLACVPAGTRVPGTFVQTRKSCPTARMQLCRDPDWGVRTVWTLATHGFRVETWKATGSPAQRAVLEPPVWWVLCGEQCHVVPRREGPLSVKLTLQRKRQINPRASPDSDKCCERNKQHAHCGGSFYMATWLGRGALIFGYSGCYRQAVFG